LNPAETEEPSLFKALRLARQDVVAVAGAGGKTTLVRRLAEEANAAGLNALVTSTTHMGAPPEGWAALIQDEGGTHAASALASALIDRRRAVVVGFERRPGRFAGLSPERVDRLAAGADVVLVEADGARGRSLKVPGAHEPVVPRSATLLLACVGLGVLGRLLDARSVHRLELVCVAAGRAAGSVVDEDVVAAALLSGAGYLSRVPPAGRAAVFLNQAEDEPRRAAAQRLALRLLSRYDAVAAGSARGGPVRFWS
jgi:probable selenium-dependent hydroxylase accessory protein YqeC